MFERSVDRARGRASRDLWLTSTALAAGLAALTALPQPALADCAAAGSIISCSGTTAAPGYGDGTQANQTITIQAGGTVLGGSGIAPENTAAIFVGDGNNINNGGAITGGIDAIASSGNILVNNTASITANGGIGVNSGGDAVVNSTGTISGQIGVQAVGLANVVNSGTISGPTGKTFEGVKGETVKLVNSGTIKTAYVGVDAGTGGANVINQGTIQVSEALSAAISSNGGLTLDNSGIISGSVSTLTGDASVANKGSIDGVANIGIYTAGQLTLNNTGQIQSSGDGVSTIGAATIVINNVGKITASGAGSEGVTAYTSLSGTNSGQIAAANDGIGIHAFQDMTLTNLGTITTGNTTSGTTQAVAVEADNVLNLVNKGNITTGTTGANIAIQAGASALINNQAKIVAAGDQSYAIYSGGDANLTNSGTITATGAGATGLYAGGSAVVANSSTIAADDTAISAKYLLTLNNTSKITAGSVGAAAGSDATIVNSGSLLAPTGVLAGGTATVTNSGTIGSGGTGGFGVSAATAVKVNNTGTITGETGIAVTTGGASSTIVNAGKIIGTGGTAIQLTNAADTITLKESSKIQGIIAAGGGGDTINVETGKSTGSQVIEFDTLDGAKVNITGSRSGQVVGSSIVIVDTTDFIVADSALMEVTGAVSNLTQRRAGNATDTRGDTTKGIWMQAIGGGSRREATSALNGWSHGFGGMLAGYEGAPYADFRIGGFVGGAMGASRVAQGAGDGVKGTYAMAGLYGRYQPGAFFLDFNLAFGYVSNNSTRTITSNIAANGVETATARSSGAFVSPQIGAGYRIQYDQSATITPSVRARYLTAQYGSYSEANTSAPIDMGGRSYQAVETRTEVEFARARRSANGASFRLYQTIGLMSQTRLTAGVMNASILGTQMTITTPGARTTLAGYIGGGVEYKMPRGVTLFANFETQFRTDRTISGNVRAGANWIF